MTARLLVSAAHKSSGKTTLSIGLCAALRGQGLAVRPFKKGPDYIDPLWLAAASGHPCHNLDFYLMERGEIVQTFLTQARGADIALIEGNKGLYDGLDLEGSNSNAALAKLLATPVVLVIDARGMTRGIAPLILGYQAFDRVIRIAGVILNRLGGSRHESKLRAVIEHYTDVPVLGAVHQDPALEIAERHLGLIPSNEVGAAQSAISAIGQRIATQVDLDAVLAIARSAPPLPGEPLEERGAVFSTEARGAPPTRPAIRLGVARDAAFAFYYPGDLDRLRQAGAELVFFDTLRDARLPAVDGLFIGGGFPETHLAPLAANTTLLADLRRAIEAGLPTYAECGGLMVLARSITWGDRSAAMVGVIPADVVMHGKPVGRGYVRLRETGRGPWPMRRADGEPGELRAHEFHYSSLENLPADTVFAYHVARGHGIDGRHDGIVYKNLLASYTHLRDVGDNHWTERFVAFVRHHRGQPLDATPAAPLPSP